MKKLILLAVSLAAVAVIAPSVMATDICSDTPLSSADYNVEITSGVHLRTVSCMQESTVIATLSAGEVVHVIGLTEGWHKIQRADGTTGWIWETFVTSTTKPFNPSDPVPTLYVEPEPEITYEPMRDISGHKYEDAVWYVYNNDIVEGYEDGSYKPDQNINRAELLKIIVEAKYEESEYNAFIGVNCFWDVPTSEWYTKYVCFGADEGIVEGYSDGSFKPAQNINFVEALKMAMVGFGYGYTEGTPWYMPTVVAASGMNAIPLDVNAFSELYTRGQMAEMITRMLKYQDDTLLDYIHESSYTVSYDTIEAGLNVEDLVDASQCLYGTDVYENGETLVVDECTDCACGQGNWMCTGLCMDEPVDTMTEDLFVPFGDITLTLDTNDEVATIYNDVFGLHVEDRGYLEADLETLYIDPLDVFTYETCEVAGTDVFQEYLDNTLELAAIEVPFREDASIVVTATKNPALWTLGEIEDFMVCSGNAYAPIGLFEDGYLAFTEGDIILWVERCEEGTVQECTDEWDTFFSSAFWFTTTEMI